MHHQGTPVDHFLLGAYAPVTQKQRDGVSKAEPKDELENATVVSNVRHAFDPFFFIQFDTSMCNKTKT